jgi:hypothetical protein
MHSLGLTPFFPAPSQSVRFSMLPFQVALTEDPHRVISPALHYTNADPTSGKYQNRADGTMPRIAWALRLLCLTPSNVMQIRRLPDLDKTVFDVDLVMTNASDRGFRYEICRVSNNARWKLDPTFAQEVEQKATEIGSAFAAKLAGKPGIT